MCNYRFQSALLLLVVINLIKCSSAHDHILQCGQLTEFSHSYEPGMTLTVSFILALRLGEDESISWNMNKSGERARCPDYMCPSKTPSDYGLILDFDKQSFTIFKRELELGDSGNYSLWRYKNETIQCHLASFRIYIIGASSSVTSLSSTMTVVRTITQDSSTERKTYSSNKIPSTSNQSGGITANGYQLNNAVKVISSLAFIANILIICFLVAACKHFYTKDRFSGVKSGQTTSLETETDVPARVTMISELKRSIEQQQSGHNFSKQERYEEEILVDEGPNEHGPTGDHPVLQQDNEEVCLDSDTEDTSTEKFNCKMEDNTVERGKAPTSTNNDDCDDSSSLYSTLKRGTVPLIRPTDPGALKSDGNTDDLRDVALGLNDGEPVYENVSRSKQPLKPSESLQNLRKSREYVY